jgi:ribulose-phosphate 3-epimerase
MVLIMTVNPGFGGQKYITAMTEKIRALRKTIFDKGLSVDIQVDGGINDTTIHTVLEAGANICVAGSGVFNQDCKGSVKKYLEIMNQYTQW